MDPYAELFCRAVGGSWADVLDGNAADHELQSDDFGKHFVNFQGARTKYFDAYFRRAVEAGVRQVVVLAAGWIRAPTDCPGRTGPPSSSWTDLRSSISSVRCSVAMVFGRAPSVRRSPSICETIGPRRYGTAALMPKLRRRGSPKGC
ncbi:putative S-adenosyl-L-methionine-dependent methyltransferase [Mycobacterium ulcerans str. Harvey]|uniref:S-adenosyl-L-methionine-dependent methyltransferase n=1 Tax=Mycobacterium ulcerans str. Harvey TaxID=1299332 RepID=A0ABP3AMK6_MYCUL|nr:putative S-adenosyl-L-methionine-dependent methyltransferase [Mycobacterium ulcerans str. Harvey]